MNSIVSAVIAVLFSCACVINARFFLKKYYEQDYVKSFWLKGMAAVSFSAVGVTLLWSGNYAPFACKVVGGLLLGVLGDQLLALRLIFQKQHDFFFTLGALSFGVGHVLYMLALQGFCAVSVWCVLPVLAVGILLSLVYAKRKGTDVGKKTPLAAGYIMIVLLMASIAVCVAVTTGTLTGILFAVGGILFSVSDNILCAYCYGKDKVWRLNRDLHIAYYGAQLAIAWSIMFL